MLSKQRHKSRGRGKAQVLLFMRQCYMLTDTEDKHIQKTNRYRRQTDTLNSIGILYVSFVDALKGGKL